MKASDTLKVVLRRTLALEEQIELQQAQLQHLMRELIATRSDGAGRVSKRVQPANVKLAYRFEEGLALIGKSKRAGYRAMQDGTLRTFKDGKNRMVSHAALVEYIEKLERDSAKGLQPCVDIRRWSV